MFYVVIVFVKTEYAYVGRSIVIMCNKKCQIS